MPSEGRGNLERAYEALEAADFTPGHLRVVAAGIQIPDQGAVMLGVDVDGARCVLVPSSRTGARRERKFRGLSLAHRDLEDPQLDLNRYLVLRCEAPELRHIFVDVADAALRSLELDPSDPETAFTSVIDDFRSLFGRGRRLGERDLAWLFVELRVLQLFVDRGEPIAVWRGPDHQRHDFVTRGGALEVKSTLSANHRRFIVHGLRQLEPPGSGSLFLHLVRVEPTLGGATVPDAVAQLVSSGADLEELEGRLNLVGYYSEHAVDYQSGFDILEEETHLVDASFPRLTSEDIDLPVGVTTIDYEVDLSAVERPPSTGIAQAIRELSAK